MNNNTAMVETTPFSTPNEVKKNTNPRLDSGWGWVVCFGAFLVHTLTVGQQNIAGVIYSVLVDEFNSKRAETGARNKLNILFRSIYVLYILMPGCSYLGRYMDVVWLPMLKDSNEHS